MQDTAIQKLFAAARSAEKGLLDELVSIRQTTSLSLLGNIETRKTFYVDVPLDKIVSLSTNAFWKPGDTWREATYGLHGNGWTDEVFEYFERDLRENVFPAPACAGPLFLTSVGGACECSSGNHRLVAGKTWLAWKYGAAAFLKKAKIATYLVNTELIPLLKLASDTNSVLYIAHSTINPKFVESIGGSIVERFFWLKNTPDKIFALTKDGITSIKLKTRSFAPLIRTRNPPAIKEYRWFEISSYLIKRVLSDTWLSPQLADAEPWIK